MNCFCLGMTGGPGCGKSAAADYFKSAPGWFVLDADQICRKIYEDPDSKLVKQIKEHWGRDSIQTDGTPNRQWIANKVFSSLEERIWLNSVLHPEILRRLMEQAEQTEEHFVLIEVPLLFETGWDKNMNKTAAVWTAPEIQMQRLLGRGWSREHAEARIASQFPADKKLEMADYGIINSSSMESMKEQCCLLDKIIKKEYSI